MWKEIHIDNWEHYNKVVLKLNPKDWIFRGQNNVDWKLETSFHRAAKYIKEVKRNAKQRVYNRDSYEKEIINQFKSQYHLYQPYSPESSSSFIVELIKNPTDENIEVMLEWLSIMQHYGAPTRLLDWTFSPYIALFFAMENAPNDSCVYAINQNALDIENKDNFGTNYKKDVMKPNKYGSLFLRAYEPSFKNERLVRQQGLFLVPNSNFASFDDILDTYDNISENAIKILIDKELHFKFLITLKRMNITYETLFPGIDGFCKSLKFSLLETAENVKRIK